MDVAVTTPPKRGPGRPRKPRKMGRPTLYTDSVAAEICALIAEGKPVAQIVKIQGMPKYRTIMTWLNERQDFQQNYARARQDQADTFADEIINVARNAIGKPNEVVQASRLLSDNMKWVASKMKPKRYGDRVELEAGPSLAEFLKTL